MSKPSRNTTVFSPARIGRGNLFEAGGRGQLYCAEKPQGGPREDDDWWDNLLNTYRRFESDEVPDIDLKVRFRGIMAQIPKASKTAYPHIWWMNAPQSRSDRYALSALTKRRAILAAEIIQLERQARPQGRAGEC